MNMRQHKRLVQSKIMYGLVWAGIVDDLRHKPLVELFRGAAGISHSYPSPDWVGHGDRQLMELADSVKAMVEEAKVEFVCTRVKDGVVVDTFDTREAALALVNKHIKGKKAKLQVMNSATGELVLFSEEEFA